MFALLVGCETTGNQTHAAKNAPKPQIEVFKDGTKPSKLYREIGVLKDDGKEIEQEDIEAKMLKKAAKMGGSAIIFEKPKPSGAEGSIFGMAFGDSKFTYLYKATVVVYE